MGYARKLTVSLASSSPCTYVYLCLDKIVVGSRGKSAILVLDVATGSSSSLSSSQFSMQRGINNVYILSSSTTMQYQDGIGSTGITPGATRTQMSNVGGYISRIIRNKNHHAIIISPMLLEYLSKQIEGKDFTA